MYYIANMAKNGSKYGDKRPPLPVFLATTVIVFFSTLSAADSIGFVPYYVDGSPPPGGSGSLTTGSSAASVPLSGLPQLGSNSTTSTESAGVLPTRIEIGAVGIDLPVQNIKSTDIDVLYEDLKSGPIRYTDSARLGEEGNVLIFGHSSRLPVVKNQMYKAFNSVPDVESGDVITLTGEDGKKYLYSVVSVEQKDTEDPRATISLAKEGKYLTLVTCDTLSGKTARFVLTADFIGVI